MISSILLNLNIEALDVLAVVHVIKLGILSSLALKLHNLQEL